MVEIKNEPRPYSLDSMWADIVGDNPEVGQVESAKLIILRQPYNIEFLYRHKQGGSLSLQERKALASIKSGRTAYDRLMDTLVHSGRYELDRNVFTRMKHRLLRNNVIIFGSCALGYVALKDMNFDRALKFYYPRGKMDMCECRHMSIVTEILSANKMSAKQRAVSDLVRNRIADTYKYPELVEAIDGITCFFGDKP